MKNYTPHSVTVDGVVYPMSSPTIRLDTTRSQGSPTKVLIPETGKYISCVPPVIYDKIVPEDIKDKAIIVSALVGNYLEIHPEVYPDVQLVVVPDTNPGSTKRDSEGQILESKQFVVYRQPIVGRI